jgi:hypothetical protein
MAVAQLERRSILLGDVEQEGLAQQPRSLRGLVEPVARGVVVAQRDRRRDKPGDRVAREVEVVQLAGKSVRLEQHLVHVLVRPRPSRPERRRQRLREARLVPQPP